MTKLENDKRAQDDEVEQERRRLEVIDIYEKVIKEAEDIRDTWRHYVATETELCNRNPNYFLLRFTPGTLPHPGVPFVLCDWIRV
jgi:hypothetical protein